MNPSPALNAPDLLRRKTGEQDLTEAAKSHGLTPEQLETAIASAAHGPSAIDRGIADFLKGQYPEAEKMLTDAAPRQESDLLETLSYLGTSQFEQAEFEKAASTFQRALALRPDSPVLANALGLTFLKLAKFSEAERLFRLALAIDEKEVRP